MEMQLMEWENIFANNHIFHKMLVSKVNKELKEPKRKENNNIPIKDCREPEYTFSKGDIQMASRNLKKCSASLIISEIQIKTTMRYHLTCLYCCY